MFFLKSIKIFIFFQTEKVNTVCKKKKKKKKKHAQDYQPPSQCRELQAYL